MIEKQKKREEKENKLVKKKQNKQKPVLEELESDMEMENNLEQIEEENKN